MNTAENTSHSDAEQSHQSADFYRSLAAEAVPAEAERKISGEDYAAQARDIFRTIHNNTGRLGLRGAHETARNVYVDEEENDQLKDFSRQLLELPHEARRKQAVAAELQVLKDKRRDLQAKDKDLSEPELQDMRRKVKEMCEFNHQIRDLIVNGDLERGMAEAWMVQGGAEAQWAMQVMQGVAAEMAAHEFFEGMDGVESVRYGTVDEDMRDGSDLFVTFTDGKVVRVDVKSGNEAAASQRRSVMEVVIPSKSIDGFMITDGDTISKLDDAFFNELDGPGSRVAWSSN